MSLLCLGWNAASQESGFVFRDFKLPQSFRNKIVTNVEKDKAGLLWLATNSGLYRYDGNEAIFFDGKSQPALNNSKITSIFSDTKNNMWLGTESGLIRFDLHKWMTTEVKTAYSKEAPSRQPHFESIGEGRNGTIYAGTLDGRLFRVEKDSLQVLLDINHEFPNQYNLPSVAAVSEPYPNELWLRTEMGKMIRIRIRGGQYMPPEYFGLPEFHRANIREVYFHRSGKCILNITGHGIYIFDTRKGSFHKIPELANNGVGQRGIVFLAPYMENEILIFTNQPDIGKEQLFVYNFQTNSTRHQLVTYPEYLRSNHIEWFKNPGNTLFMSLNNRILELAPAKNMFKSILTDAVAINSIRSIYKHKTGTLYVGSYKDRFISIDESTGKKESISNHFVYKILPWGPDSLLLGTEGDGMLWYDIRSKKISPIRLDSDNVNNREPGSYITALVRKSETEVWVGTYSGLFLVDLKKKTHQPIEQNVLGQLKITSLAHNEDQLWIGTPLGLTVWNSGQNKIVINKEKNPVYCVIPVGDTFWIGTHGAGIRILNKNGQVLQTLDNANGLADDIVYSILTSDKKAVAATHNGLSVIDRKTLQIHNYSRLDQLPADEFNQAAAFHEGDSFYLGTINGILKFRTNDTILPLSTSASTNIALHITSLTTEHANHGLHRNYSFPYQANRSLTIEGGTRYFTIGFGVVSGATGELKYFYKLDSALEWVPLGSRQEITFVEMPPGEYNLHLTAQLPDGTWTDTKLTVPLLVVPLFHQTVWFKGLMVLMFLFLIWCVFRYREYIIRKEKNLRVSIASDLHDEVGSSLTRIYYQADSLSAKAIPLSNGSKQLEQIAETSRDALLTMSDMVWSIDARFDTVKDLIDRMKDYVYKLREELNIAYHFEVKGEYTLLTASQIVRQNLFLIFKEALTNATKYGDGKAISIEIQFDGNPYLKIRNSYVNGLQQVAKRQGGRGLHNMETRAIKMGGRLCIEEGNGIFLLTVEIAQLR